MTDVHLVLTHYWFDEIYEGQKTVEYRDNIPFWQKRIIEKKPNRVIFHRGYTNEVILAEISKIDIGECPYEGWDDKYIRVHFCNVEGKKI